MLEGLLHPISGSQSVWASTFKDKNCPEKLERVPQHNAFFEKLTLRYNLGLYATFKGVARNQIKKRVDNTIFDLTLTHPETTCKHPFRRPEAQNFNRDRFYLWQKSYHAWRTYIRHRNYYSLQVLANAEKQARQMTMTRLRKALASSMTLARGWSIKIFNRK